MGSVLIMPGHSLEQEKAVSDFAEYVRFVESLSQDFSHVVICLHGIDYDKGHAREAFETAGFQVIRGSAIEDSNSLERMAFLFSRFEYVSTNDDGSHVYYAAAAGCKVSIEGPPSVRDLDGLKSHPFYREFPEGLGHLHKTMSLRQEIFPFLYGPLKNAELRIDWALDQLGYPEKRSPRNLKRTLGWTFTSRFIRRQRPKLGKIFYSLVRLKAPGSANA